MQGEKPKLPQELMPEIDDPEVVSLINRIDTANETRNTISIPDGGGEKKIPNPYVILGISGTATLDDIKDAYRALAKKVHPDVVGSGKYQKEFNTITESYSALCNTGLRRQIDAAINSRSSARASGGASNRGEKPAFSAEQILAEELIVYREWKELEGAEEQNTIEYLEKIVRFIENRQIRREMGIISDGFFSKLSREVQSSFIFSIERNLERLGNEFSEEESKQSDVELLATEYSKLFAFFDKVLARPLSFTISLNVEHWKLRMVSQIDILFQWYAQKKIDQLSKKGFSDVSFSLEKNFSLLNHVIAILLTIHQKHEDSKSGTEKAFLNQALGKLSYDFIKFLLVVNRNVVGIENTRFLARKVKDLPVFIIAQYNYRELIGAVQDGLSNEYQIAIRNAGNDQAKVNKLNTDKQHDYEDGLIPRRPLS